MNKAGVSRRRTWSRTLREWAGQHGQVSLRRGVLLEAEEAALLEQIKRDKRIKLPHGRATDRAAWLVREADSPELAERLRKAGYGLAGDGADMSAPLKRTRHDRAVHRAGVLRYACAKLGSKAMAAVRMRQRVARLLPEKQLNRAYQASHGH